VWGADQAADDDTEASEAAKPAGEIHFGASLSLAGALAHEGRLVRDGYEFIIVELRHHSVLPGSSGGASTTSLTTSGPV
jgi:hypothetical protein